MGTAARPKVKRRRLGPRHHEVAACRVAALDTWNRSGAWSPDLPHPGLGGGGAAIQVALRPVEISLVVGPTLSTPVQALCPRRAGLH